MAAGDRWSLPKRDLVHKSGQGFGNDFPPGPRGARGGVAGDNAGSVCRAPDMFDRLKRLTRLIFYLGSFFFFLAAAMQYMRGAGINGEYLLGGALMGFAPAVLDYLDERFGPD